jgi:hypothetical protein
MMSTELVHWLHIDSEHKNTAVLLSDDGSLYTDTNIAVFLMTKLIYIYCGHDFHCIKQPITVILALMTIL